MRRVALISAACLAILVGCSTGNGPYKPSKTPAAQANLAAAQKAAAACARHTPDGRAVAASLRSLGFTPKPHEALDTQAAKLPAHQFFTLLGSPTDVVVLLRERKGKQTSLFCSVSLRNMTVSQANQIALVWAQKYGASSKKLFKRTPLKNDLLDWQGLGSRYVVQIGIVDSVGYLDGPGAATILRYSTKDAGAPVSSPTYVIGQVR